MVKINSFATSCYRIMWNIRRIDGIPNATIYSLIETAPLIERVRLRQLSLLGHVLRLPENEPVIEFAMYAPSLLFSGGSLKLAKWQSGVGNRSRPLSMEETCGRMMMKISFLQYRKPSIKRQSGGLIYFTPIWGGGGLNRDRGLIWEGGGRWYQFSIKN